MASTSWPVHSRFAREHFGRGKEEGRAEGRAEGMAEAILEFLAARGIAVSDTARDRICGCADVQLLNVWLKRAVSANTVTDLFD